MGACEPSVGLHYLKGIRWKERDKKDLQLASVNTDTYTPTKPNKVCPLTLMHT